MIPKIIHYCWFGRAPLPDKAKKCIESWRKHCPNYTILEWNENNFDIHQNGYTEMCCKEKKVRVSRRLRPLADHRKRGRLLL